MRAKLTVLGLALVSALFAPVTGVTQEATATGRASATVIDPADTLQWQEGNSIVEGTSAGCSEQWEKTPEGAELLVVCE